MKRTVQIMCVAGVVAVLGSAASICHAAITWSDDVDPPDPATWTTSTDAHVGQTGVGSITVDGGSDLVSGWAQLGYNTGSNGTVTVSGAGSTWINGSRLVVGWEGGGTLNIADGGVVETDAETWVARGSGSSGAINFNNGTLLTVGLSCAPSDLTGTGTINTNGLVSDVDLVFDAIHGIAQTLTLNGPGQNITVNLTVDGSAEMGAGYSGNGSMHISDGLAMQSIHGSLGFKSSSTGVVTVSGAESAWTNSLDLYVGYQGDGTLGITDGGTVSDIYGYIGYTTGSTGAATVSGAGSTWSNGSLLSVGNLGDGTLDITDGGTVSDTNGHIGSGSGSTGAVTVSGIGSTLTNSAILIVGFQGYGTLGITGGGTVANPYGWIGYNTGSTGAVTVSGAESTWATSDSLYVGGAGNATLEITNGGTVSNAHGFIGYSSGSTGTVTVDGAGSTWDNSFDLYVGNGGSGTVTVQEGGELRVGNELSIVPGSALNVLGGTVRFKRPDPMLFASEDMNFTFGTLAFDCDVIVTGTGLVNDIFGASPTISGANGLEISGTATLGTPVTLDGGTLSVGSLVNASMLTFNTGTLNLTQGKLTVGLGGMLGRTVEVADGQTIQVASDADVEATGLLLISGGAFAPAWTTNFGEIRLGADSSPGAALLAGGGLGNYGLVTGDGRISASLTNLEGGLVSVGPGQRLLLTGGENSNGGTMTTTGGEIEALRALNNTGQINVVDGTFSVGGALNNGGQINVVDGTFSVGGILMNIGPSSYISGQGNVTLRAGNVLSNTGTVGFSAATAGLYGDIYNGAGGLIAVAGESTATFVGTVENFGDIYVGDGSKAVFLSRVSGTGDFPGGGDVEFVDGFSPSPGASPAAVSFGGDVIFAASALLEIELGGTTAGDDYDMLDIAGDLTPGGTLQVVLIDDFAPSVGDTFDILDWDTLGGAEFDAVELPPLTGRKAWDTSDLYITGEISVIGMLDGDTDVDWDVDSVDLGNLAAVFGGEGDLYTDFNEDGRVDLADFALMRANFGAGVGSGAPGDATAATPEPATLILLAGGLPVLLRRRRRQFATDERG